jgi:hypothetical protein
MEFNHQIHLLRSEDFTVPEVIRMLSASQPCQYAKIDQRFRDHHCLHSQCFRKEVVPKSSVMANSSRILVVSCLIVL